MRVAFLSWRDTAHPQAGGSEVVVDRLARGLVSRGHDVVLFHGGPSASHPYPSHSAGGTYTQYARVPWSFHRRAGDIDVVVDVGNGIPFFSPVWQRAPVVLVVHHVHTQQWAMQFPAPIAAFGRWLEGRAVPALYRHGPVVAVSRSTATDLAGIGIDPQRIATIEMGVDLAPARPQRSPTPRFLVLGRLVPHKRVELAIAAWERVRRTTGGELVVAGEGPQLDQLRSTAGESVTFLGRVDEERKLAELGATWLLVHPAHHEGWGIVILEAAAAGTPTVAFDVPGVRDAVADGVTGLLATDEDEFAEHWVRLATDEALRSTMGHAARRRASALDWSRSVDAFEETLERAVGSRTRR